MRNLYIGDLLESVTKPDLEKEFQVFGKLQDVWVAHNPPGFAFVEYIDKFCAAKAVRALDGKNVLGSKIRVEFAKNGPRGQRVFRGRKRMAGSPPPPFRRRRRSLSPQRRRSPPRRGRSPMLSLRMSSPPRRGLPPPPPMPPPLIDFEMRHRVIERRGRFNGYDRSRTPPMGVGFRGRSRSPIGRRRYS